MTSGSMIFRFFAVFLIIFFILIGKSPASGSPETEVNTQETAEKSDLEKDPGHEFSWEMPGRVSIYDLQFGAAEQKDKKWKLIANARSFNAGSFKDKLTLMVSFAYKGSKPDLPIKFIVKVPSARQYEETVHLANPSGRFTYQFTIHNPENFIGNGSVYLYYGFSMVDVLAFTIMPGS